METLDNDINVIDPSTVSSRPAGIKWGLIWGGISVVLALVAYIAGFSDPSSQSLGTYLLGFFGIILSVIMIVMAIRQHRDEELGGYIRGGRCVSVGLWAGLVYGVVYGIWTIIFTTFIAPDFYDGVNSMLINEYEEAGMADDFIDKMLGWVKMTQGPVGAFISSLLGGTLFGMIISAIAALFMKKKSPGMF